jgi:hypothetical protein
MPLRQTITATVIDTNHRPRGQMDVDVVFDHDDPVEVVHDGQTYFYTGKDGIWTTSGEETREMATADDARLWITRDGQTVLED